MFGIDTGLSTGSPASSRTSSCRALYTPAQQQVFFRGGLLLLVADSPQRATMCKSKHPNNSSKFPCVYCMVEQKQGSDDEGGPLGDPQFDIEAHARTRGQMLEGREKLSALAPNPNAQAKLSKDLGIVAPLPNEDWLLYDVMDCIPARMTPVEILHADSLASVV